MRYPLVPCALLSSFLWLGATLTLGAPARERPNVIILLADDLGFADLSSYGATDIKTPAIDSLARDGLKLTRFYSNSPECTPSRTALLTGRHPQRVGGLECAIGVGNVGRYDEAEWLQQRGELGLPASELTLAERFREAGYTTAIFGKWHLGYDTKFSPKQHGFDESLVILGGAVDYVTHTEVDGAKVMRHNDAPAERKGYLTDVITDHAIAWLAQPRTNPFFLYLPYTAPHDPYQGPGDGPVTGPFSRGTRDTYRLMVQHLDRRIGDLLTALDRSGAARNTLIVFLSDNGGNAIGSNRPLRAGKTTMWEGGIRVPCLLRWPAGLPRALESAQVAQSIDLSASLLSAARIAPVASQPLDGVSLLDVWRGDKAPYARTLYWRYKRADNRRKAILEGDLKLVVDNAKKELYDLSSDPEESLNLFADQPAKAGALEAKLIAWEASVAAPRLRDFQPAARPSAR